MTMLLEADVNTTVSRTYAIEFPYYAKHIDHDWFLLITEDVAIEVLPWCMKIERRDEFPSFWKNKAITAVSQDYKPCEKKRYERAADAFIADTIEIIKTKKP